MKRTLISGLLFVCLLGSAASLFAGGSTCSEGKVSSNGPGVGPVHRRPGPICRTLCADYLDALAFQMLPFDDVIKVWNELKGEAEEGRDKPSEYQRCLRRVLEEAMEKGDDERDHRMELLKLIDLDIPPGAYEIVRRRFELLQFIEDKKKSGRKADAPAVPAAESVAASKSKYKPAGRGKGAKGGH